MTPGPAARELLPEVVVDVLDEFRRVFLLDLHLWRPSATEGLSHLYPLGEKGGEPRPDSFCITVPTRDGPEMTLEVRGGANEPVRSASTVIRIALEHLYDCSEEIRFFRYEVSERYEEINLLYSISETLGSLPTACRADGLPWRSGRNRFQLGDASRLILTEVCDVMAAHRGSLWVLDSGGKYLHLVASVGEEGRETPITADDPTAVTAKVFREGSSLILTGNRDEGDRPRPDDLPPGTEPVLSVPIRYTPPDSDPRTVGVLNLIGRKHGGRFTVSDQKLLAAIASQVGAALENNRLVRESLERERVTRELELAHDLQMKLLPTADGFDPERVAARVEPAESVGGDFYHFFRIPGDRYGVMIGDVSSHGFPAALIMALSMSAATIYASQAESPAHVLQEMGNSLTDELESTEMYLTLFYGVVDPLRGQLLYANAGHPHAFAIRGDGCAERLEAMDPPMGIAGNVAYHQRTVDWNRELDLLLLFTDGLSDDLVEGSRTAGERQVVEQVVGLRDRPVSEVVDSLFKLDRGGGVTTDDRTAVVLRV